MVSLKHRIDLRPILAQVETGDPVGAAYRLSQEIGEDTAASELLYEAGSIALSRRAELGEDALRFARLVFEESVEKDPGCGEARHDLATTMRELGMAEDAILQYRRALELLPDDADCLVGLGAAQCDANRLDEAVETLKQASIMHPGNGAAHANLGIAYESMTRDEDAAAAYGRAVLCFEEQLLEAEDDDEVGETVARRRFARMQYAEALERLERWPQAITEYRRLFEEEQAADLSDADDDEEVDDEDLDEDVEPEVEMVEATPADDEIALAVEEARLEAVGRDRPEAPPASDSPIRIATEREEALDAAAEAGRTGLTRLFLKLVTKSRCELAYLVLDDLGGEIADHVGETTYLLEDAGDGHQSLVAKPWDGARRVLYPAPRALTEPG